MGNLVFKYTNENIFTERGVRSSLGHIFSIVNVKKGNIHMWQCD